MEKITHSQFLTWYKIETNTENTKKFLVRKLHTNHVRKLVIPSIVSPHQELSMVKVSTSYHIWKLRYQVDHVRKKKPYMLRAECCIVMKSYMQIRNVWFYCFINKVRRISLAEQRWFWIFWFYVSVVERCFLEFH